MNLIIVESPTKARTLSRFLGKDYESIATTGHIMDLPKSKLGVDVEKDFKPDYQIVEGRDKTIKEIISKAKKSSKTYIATDPDREGEAIAGHVRDFLQEKKLKPIRIEFHEITKDAVEEAIKNPRSINEGLIDAQIARRVLDRLVGYKLSPLLWKKVRRGLSAGRVQSVAVRLIVEKEDEIKAFKLVIYFEIRSLVKRQIGKKEEFSVLLTKINNKKFEMGEEKEAKRIVGELNNSNYKILDVKKRDLTRNPVPPFTTSTMTQAASRLFSWSAKKTMSIAQRLYEEGLITYHRTDSVNVSKEAIDKVRKYIEKEFGEKYLPQKANYYKLKAKLVQEAHEAIRPTNLSAKVEIKETKFAGGSERLYQLIWKRFVASQMSSAKIEETTISVEAMKNTNKYLLKTSGQVIKFDGWRKVWGGNLSDDVILPDVAVGENLDILKVDLEKKQTLPPARYTEASLIKMLEKLGIGRPSTYAPIISTIQTRSYVTKDEGKFFPTAVGVAVNSFITKNFPSIVDYDFTAGMEENLDEVARGNLIWKKMMAEFYGPFDKKLVDVEKNAERVKIEVEKLGKKCPTCKDGELVIRVGRFGKFISCSRFPDCKYTDKFVQKIGVKCPECKIGDVIIKTTAKRRKFYGCSRYPDCKFASWKKPGEKYDPEKIKQ